MKLLLTTISLGVAAANPLDFWKRQVTATTSAGTPTTTTNLFPTSPEIFPGNTATGAPAALALTNPVNGYGLPNATQSYVGIL